MPASNEVRDGEKPRHSGLHMYYSMDSGPDSIGVDGMVPLLSLGSTHVIIKADAR